MDRLLTAEELERSWVVANSTMNRQRRLLKTNSYAAELGLNPLEFLISRLESRERVSWLDVCCGTGAALVEAAELVGTNGLADRFEIVGIDLVNAFDPRCRNNPPLSVTVGSIERWNPHRTFDLVTCVHGFHYLGDKLGVITELSKWLNPGGRLIGHLDPKNLRLLDGRAAGRLILSRWKKRGVLFHRRRRLVEIRGPVDLSDFEYQGASDAAGPNFTGQAAVDSYYSLNR